MRELSDAERGEEGPRQVIPERVLLRIKAGTSSHAPTEITTSEITGMEVMPGVGTPVTPDRNAKKPHCFSSIR